MKTKIIEKIGQSFFHLIHKNNVVYNTCWEDPRLDRQAMNIQSTDKILMITSAGCNALDYLLDRPSEIHCVDVNPHQNALLELKVAGIRRLEFEDFFQIFGKGSHSEFRKIYISSLRAEISKESQRIWDSKIDYFEPLGKSGSFYFRGTSGKVAKAFNLYIDHLKLRPLVKAMFESESLSEQQRLYQAAFRDRLWSPFVKWMMSTDVALSFVGVPRQQRVQVENQYPGGIAQFIQDCIERVFTQISVKDNYFWWLYLTGSYTPERCPEYLKEENFQRLKKENLTERLEIRTQSLVEHLQQTDTKFDQFVLLDHMDWLSQKGKASLVEEWEEFFQHANPGSTFLWRSGGLNTNYLDEIELEIQGQSKKVPDLLEFNESLAAELHLQDRVNTYGYFAVAKTKSMLH